MLAAEIVIVVVVVVLLALAIGGSRAQRRRLERDSGAFVASLESLDHELAAARAEDRGWERATLESAARDVLAAQRSDAMAQSATLTLVRILDRPGTDEDEAVFEVRSPDAPREELVLGREQGTWVLARLS